MTGRAQVFRGLLLSLAAVLAAVTLSAQGRAYEEFVSNPRNFGGICRVYEAPDAALTPAPKGYKPFYISTYMRHGSRHLHREDYYSDPYDALNNARLAGKLTPFGESVLERVTWMWDQARGRYGDYSPLATEEHRGLAERMVRNYPSIFKGKDVSVFARSTGSARVILSMAASTERLKELNPKIHAVREGSNAHKELMNEFPVLGRDKIYPECENMIARKLDMDRLKGLLFTDKAYADAIPRLDYALWRLYMMDTNALNMGYDFDFSDLFSWEDRYVLWEATNYLMYASASSSPYNLYTAVPSAWRLVDDFRRCAVAAAGGKNDAKGYNDRENTHIGGLNKRSVGEGNNAVRGLNKRSIGEGYDDGENAHIRGLNKRSVGGGNNAVRGLNKRSMPSDMGVFPAEAASRSVKADLRYGHDMYLIPLVTLLGICAPYESDPDAVAEVWKDYTIAPMAGNLQMVFYKEKGGLFRKAGDEVLVKFLLNEREVAVGRCPKEIRDGKLSYYPLPPEPESFPYYRWSEIEPWLTALVSEAEAMTRIHAEIAKGAYTEDSSPKNTKGSRYSVQ